MKEIAVKVYDNDIEKAMRILKKKIQNDGLFKRLKLKKSYEKPSEFRRRKQREALRRERDLVSRIMETSPVGIVVLDREGRITYVNAQIEQGHGRWTAVNDE
mgnify:CR=1 FL=1